MNPGPQTAGMLLVISGPSGVGKTSLIADLLKRTMAQSERQLQLTVSCTTRAPRKGEENARDYHFISPEKFQQMIGAGEFLEYAEVYGQHYGTPRAQVEKALERGIHVLLEIDWQGARQVRECGLPQRSVFIMPPNVQALEARLTKRGLDGPETVARRIRQARAEIAHAEEASHRIVNEDFDKASEELYRWCFSAD